MKHIDNFTDFSDVNEAKGGKDGEVIDVITPKLAQKITIKKSEGFYSIVQPSQLSPGKMNTIVIPNENLEEFVKAFNSII